MFAKTLLSCGYSQIRGSCCLRSRCLKLLRRPSLALELVRHCGKKPIFSPRAARRFTSCLCLWPHIAVLLSWFPLAAPAPFFFYRVPRVSCLSLIAVLFPSFRACLSAIGISPVNHFRGHSFRRGAASWAFSCGVPGELIQLYSDWSSDCYKLYLEFCLESKLVLANQLRSAIVSLPS